MLGAPCHSWVSLCALRCSLCSTARRRLGAGSAPAAGRCRAAQHSCVGGQHESLRCLKRLLACLLSLAAATLIPSRCAWSCRARWRRWRRARPPMAAPLTSTAQVWLSGRLDISPDHFACCPAMHPHIFDALAPQTQPPARPHTSHALPASFVCCFCRVAAAGLGRAPATALGYMWWFKGWHLEDAYEHLTGKAWPSAASPAGHPMPAG
jgi:hypothetical protein